MSSRVTSVGNFYSLQPYFSLGLRILDHQKRGRESYLEKTWLKNYPFLQSATMPSVKVRGSTTSLAGGSQWERDVDIILRGGVKCFLTSGRRRLAIRFPHDVSSSNEFIEIVGLTERLEIWPKRLLNEEERNFFSFLPSGLERRHVCKYSTEKIDKSIGTLKCSHSLREWSFMTATMQLHFVIDQV